ncbi:glycosyltransferase family 2 protein [Elusimicrobiota bacterium]
MKELAVVMPVYNEEGAISNVISKWISMLDTLNIDYNIFAYNDGSKDNTAFILKELSEKYSKLTVVNKENTGHGDTIRKAYIDTAQKYTWIFQIDSDDEMSPEGFKNLWQQKNNFDFLIGIRERTGQPLIRQVISAVSRITVKIFYGFSGPFDVNCPYRLMKSERFLKLFYKIPEKTFAPNVIISGYVAKEKIKFYQTEMDYKQRQTGIVSIRKLKLLKVSVISFIQTIKFRFKGIKNVK